VKGLDCHNKKLILIQDWLVVVEKAVKNTWVPGGTERAEALEKYHNIVQSLAKQYSWEVAIEYYIHQREAAPSSQVINKS
jgi:hypothetical protein